MTPQFLEEWFDVPTISRGIICRTYFSQGSTRFGAGVIGCSTVRTLLCLDWLFQASAAYPRKCILFQTQSYKNWYYLKSTSQKKQSIIGKSTLHCSRLRRRPRIVFVLPSFSSIPGVWWTGGGGLYLLILLEKNNVPRGLHYNLSKFIEKDSVFAIWKR